MNFHLCFPSQKKMKEKDRAEIEMAEGILLFRLVLCNSKKLFVFRKKSQSQKGFRFVICAIGCKTN
jgi:hypothetical protein